MGGVDPVCDRSDAPAQTLHRHVQIDFHTTRVLLGACGLHAQAMTFFFSIVSYPKMKLMNTKIELLAVRRVHYARFINFLDINIYHKI